MEKSSKDLNIVTISGQETRKEPNRNANRTETNNKQEDTVMKKQKTDKSSEHKKRLKDFELCGCKTQKPHLDDDDTEQYEHLAREQIKEVILDFFKDSACLKDSSLSETGDNCVRISFSLAAALKAASEDASSREDGAHNYDWSNVKSTLLSEAVAEIDRKKLGSKFKTETAASCSMSSSASEEAVATAVCDSKMFETFEEHMIKMAQKLHNRKQQKKQQGVEMDDEVFVSEKTCITAKFVEGSENAASDELPTNLKPSASCAGAEGKDDAAAVGSAEHHQNEDAACENGCARDECSAYWTDMDYESAAEASFELATKLSKLRFMYMSEGDQQKERPNSDFKADLDNILNVPKYDPQIPPGQTVIKRIVSMQELSQRKDNQIEVHIIPSKTKDLMNAKTKKHCCSEAKSLNPFTDFENTLAKHRKDEFCTFCSCGECSEYREVVIRIIVEQFKASHMVVLLLDALIKAYSPLLRNATACKHFEKLLENNKEIYWIASGLLYDKKYEQLDFIYDDMLTDPMILVLFSTVLMVNNPMHLLHILSFHIECLLKAFAAGIVEVAAEDKLGYIINGYDRLSFISEKMGCFFFAFEKYFLRKFSLTWFLLCRRLYRQHVYAPLHQSVVEGSIPINRDDPCLKNFLEFDESMQEIDRRWNRVIWPKIQRYNLSAMECRRRQGLRDVHKLFDTVVQDAIVLSLQESNDENDFYSVHALENRRLAWQKIMAYTKMKWPDGFFQAPNTKICRIVCVKCGNLMNEHEENCPCVSCCIAGGPVFSKSKSKNVCEKCALLPSEKDDTNVQCFESKIVNLCTADDLKLKKSKAAAAASNAEQPDIDYSASPPAYEDLNFDLDEPISLIPPPPDNSETEELWYDLYADDVYHIAWAVFPHLSQRQRYVFSRIDAKYFCQDCQVCACLLARKLISNQISPDLSMQLVKHYQPLPIKRYELRAIFPNILLHNHKMLAVQEKLGADLETAPDTQMDMQNIILKVYWSFILSIYGTYFIDFDDVSGQPLNLDCLEIVDNDIAVCQDKLTGNPDDTRFFDFIEAIRSIVPTDLDLETSNQFFQSEELQKKLDDFLQLTDEDRELFEKKNRQSRTALSIYNLGTPKPSQGGETGQETSNDVSSSGAHSANQAKKASNAKAKKCCVEHPELGEHCKENHNAKKRLKKECNHARVNETRDRLRKKLQNARKSQQLLQNVPTQQKATNAPVQQQPTAGSAAISQQPLAQSDTFIQQIRQQQQKAFQQLQQQRQSWQQMQQQVLQSPQAQQGAKVQASLAKAQLQREVPNGKPITRQPPSLKAAAAASIKTTSKKLSGAVKKESKDMGPADKANGAATANAAANNIAKQGTKDISEEDSLKCLNTLCKRINSIDSVSKKHREPATTSDAEQKVTKGGSQASTANNKEPPSINNKIIICEHIKIDPPANKTSSSTANGAAAAFPECSAVAAEGSADAGGNSDIREAFNEIYQLLDKDKTKMNKWINETLNYIEGFNNKKAQPQAADPKKTAKRAKQKLRKEEEKRIAELHEARDQFTDLYFKEFAGKLELKTLRANKKKDNKKDEKKIADIESNNKRLQRAKANVEANILELLATVKQTSSDFKFTYLPTKEQQLEKIKQLEEADAPAGITANADAADEETFAYTASPDPNGMQQLASMNMPVPLDLINTNTFNYVGVAPPPPPAANIPGQPIAYQHIPPFPPFQLSFPQPPPPQNAIAYGLIRPPALAPAPMCYSPAQLPPNVVAAMAANAAAHASTEPKPVVTIRRVNIPNGPEPQVTISTKGNSPEQDKLLYTFVNGQLVPAGITTMQQAAMPMEGVPNMAPEHILDIPPPPLTKKQLKKERRRQAKTLLLLQEFLDPELDLEVKFEDENEEAHEEEAPPSNHAIPGEKSKKQKKKKNKSNQNQNLVNTAEAKSDQATTDRAGNGKGKNNDSTMTTNKTKEPSKNEKQANSKQSKKKDTDKLKPTKAQPQKTEKSKASDTHRSSTSSTATGSKSTLTSDSETASSTLANTRESSAASSRKQSNAIKAKITKPAPKATGDVSANKKSQKQSEPSALVSKEAAKKEKTKHKRIDKGQFDNNPWKALHMQDSDSDLVTSEESSDEEMPEVKVEEEPFEAVTTKGKGKSQKTMAKSEDTTDCAILKSQKQSNANNNFNKKATATQQQSKQSETLSSKTKAQLPKVAKTNEKTAATASLLVATKNPVANESLKNAKKGQKQKSVDVATAPAPDSSQGRSNRAELTAAPAVNRKPQQNGNVQARKTSDAGTSSADLSAKGKNRNNLKDTKKHNEISHPAAKSQSMAPQQRTQASQTVSFVPAQAKRVAQRQNQRNKKSSKQQQTDHGPAALSTPGYGNYGSGIPEHMGYFNPNDADVLQHQYLPKRTQIPSHQYDNLANKFQGLSLQGSGGSEPGGKKPQHASQNLATNNSIMEQLSRGIQVEHLALPPGITLTKVDPAKSEALRQKNESIGRLSKPLQTQTPPQAAFQHSYPMPHNSSTIIAPPVLPSSNYHLNTPYSSVLSSGVGGRFDQSGIIMVEANPTANRANKPNVAAAAAAAAATGKTTSKSKRRRNKNKGDPSAASLHSNSSNGGRAGEHEAADKQPKMVTLRNPMFHGGPANAATTMLQQPGIMGRPMGGMPFGAPMPVDQPAAIIKNENGMFTIRNPLLHQAVTNGLAMGGYGQFGSVNYYTPQEAAAEARSAQQKLLQQQQQQQRESESRKEQEQLQQRSAAKSPQYPESFSYFSNTVNEMPPQPRKISSNASLHNDISISCSPLDSDKNFGSPRGAPWSSDLQERSSSYSPAAIARPQKPSNDSSQPSKCLSAIGSEIKQKSKEYQPWSNFSGSPADHQLRRSTENLAGGANLMAGLGGDFTHTPSVTASSLQDPYNNQHSYYNGGFDVFTPREGSAGGGSSITPVKDQLSARVLESPSLSSQANHAAGGNSLFRDSHGHHGHMHHNCGDDSPPPPSLLNYTGTYLDDIPNTGVIKYDDASFLKNLIPGQNLNKEVSIHKVNESHFGRNAANSPNAKHLVEITPIYGASAGLGAGEDNLSSTASAPTTPKDLSGGNRLQHQYNSQLGRSGGALSNESISPLGAVGQRRGIDATSVSPPSCGVSPLGRTAKISPSLNDFKIDAFSSFKFSDMGQQQQHHRQKNLMELFGSSSSGSGPTANTSATEISPRQQQPSLLANSPPQMPSAAATAAATASNQAQRTSPYMEEFVQNLNALKISSSGAGATLGSAGTDFLNNHLNTGSLLYSNNGNGNSTSADNCPPTSKLHSSNNIASIASAANNNSSNANAANGWW